MSMPAKLIELRDQLIIDANIEGDAKFPIPRLNRMISLAERYVQTELNSLGMKKWEKSLLVTASGGVSDGLINAAFNHGTNNCDTISIPFVDGAITYLNDLLETPSSILFIDCDYLLVAAHSYGLAYEVDKDRFKEALSNTYLAPTKKNPIFMRLNNKIWISPLTDSSYLLNQVTVYYYKVITDISAIVSPATDADQNTTEIPVEFEEYVIKKAKLEIDTILERIMDKTLASRQLQSEITSAYKNFVGKQTELNRANMQDKKTKLQ
jgi:hypothetical protein